ncbi:hypothetical protein O181_062137 [Austropuccinia psidii MF-1]|uniref:Uncharacterized protein n=1 Tax=Austropuccinia psidii MF-1 TaxID=1389203 RepID=A0A9Q3ERQ3_9BASI|nr:hypothetical protein [Austropuccinia psidii MF-1]
MVALPSANYFEAEMSHSRPLKKRGVSFVGPFPNLGGPDKKGKVITATKTPVTESRNVIVTPRRPSLKFTAASQISAADSVPKRHDKKPRKSRGIPNQAPQEEEHLPNFSSVFKREIASDNGEGNQVEKISGNAFEAAPQPSNTNSNTIQNTLDVESSEETKVRSVD